MIVKMTANFVTAFLKCKLPKEQGVSVVRRPGDSETGSSGRLRLKCVQRSLVGRDCKLVGEEKNVGGRKRADGRERRRGRGRRDRRRKNVGQFRWLSDDVFLSKFLKRHFNQVH
jgi:hypothetical protein